MEPRYGRGVSWSAGLAPAARAVVTTAGPTIKGARRARVARDVPGSRSLITARARVGSQDEPLVLPRACPAAARPDRAVPVCRRRAGPLPAWGGVTGCVGRSRCGAPLAKAGPHLPDLRAGRRRESACSGRTGPLHRANAPAEFPLGTIERACRRRRRAARDHRIATLDRRHFHAAGRCGTPAASTCCRWSWVMASTGAGFAVPVMRVPSGDPRGAGRGANSGHMVRSMAPDEA